MVVCGGIQHPKLASISSSDAAFAFCREKRTYIGGGWRSNGCSLVGDPSARKQRCAKCQSAYSNITPSRFPIIYPGGSPTLEDAAVVAADESADTVPIEKLIIPDLGAVRRRLLELVQAADEDSNLVGHEEIHLAAKVLKLKGLNILDLNEQRVFTVCAGDDCHACFVKKRRANVGIVCNKCKNKKDNDKRYTERRERNKKMRVAADSSVNFRFLDGE